MASDPEQPDDTLGGLTHFDAHGAARMVDVGAKPDAPRMARARARLRMDANTLARIEAGEIGKGDVLGIARVAGIGGAKQTASLIPLCHPVRLTRVEIEFTIERALPGVVIEAEVHAIDRTGPEMEAMQAAATAALTIYDMCKAIDRGMQVVELRLLEKAGGKSGRWVASVGE